MAEKAGPLDAYRRKSSIRIEELQDYFEEKGCLQFVKDCLAVLEKDPLFRQSEQEISRQMPLNEFRHLCDLRANKFTEYNFITLEKAMENPFLMEYLYFAMGMHSWEMLARVGLNSSVSVFTGFGRAAPGVLEMTP